MQEQAVLVSPSRWRLQLGLQTMFNALLSSIEPHLLDCFANIFRPCSKALRLRPSPVETSTEVTPNLDTCIRKFWGQVQSLQHIYLMRSSVAATSDRSLCSWKWVSPGVCCRVHHQRKACLCSLLPGMISTAGTIRPRRHQRSQTQPLMWKRKRHVIRELGRRFTLGKWVSSLPT